MTDGPFNNVAMNRHLKRYGNGLVQGTSSADELTALFTFAVASTLSPIVPIIKEIAELSPNGQTDFLLKLKTDAIFSKHAKSPTADSFQKHLSNSAASQVSIDTALSIAIASTVRDQVSNSRNRVGDHCLQLNALGKLAKTEWTRCKDTQNTVLSKVDQASICTALRSGDNRSLKQASQKRTGIMDGPEG